MIVAVIAFGILVGAVLGLVGAGGAIIAVPALVYVIGVPVESAMSTSLVMAASSAVAALLPRIRGGVHWRAALTIAAAGIPASFLGTWLNQLLPSRTVLIAFAALMIVAGVLMLRPKPAQRALPTPTSPAWTITAVSAGLGVGFLTGLLGVGGGFIIVPALVLLLRLPLSLAIGTSLVITVINALAGFAAHAGVGAVNWLITFAFAGPAVIASLLAARFAKRLPERALQLAFAVLVFVVAGITLIRSLAA